MADLLTQFVQHGSVVILLIIALWAGQRGMWYWGAGVRAIVSTLERERNEWRHLAYAGMRKLGVEIPPDLMADPHSVLEFLKGTGKIEL